MLMSTKGFWWRRGGQVVFYDSESDLLPIKWGSGPSVDSTTVVQEQDTGITGPSIRENAEGRSLGLLGIGESEKEALPYYLYS